MMAKTSFLLISCVVRLYAPTSHLVTHTTGMTHLKVYALYLSFTHLPSILNKTALEVMQYRNITFLWLQVQNSYERG